MSIKERTLTQKYWHCDECGHEWLMADIHPERCPNRKCRSRKWDKDTKPEPEHEPKPVQPEKTPAVEHKPIDSFSVSSNIQTEEFGPPCGFSDHLGVSGKGPNKDLWYCLQCNETFQQPKPIKNAKN